MTSHMISDLYEKFKVSNGVCTDNRQIFEGCIFWGIKGPNFNGNDFAEKALDQGAMFAVVDEQEKSGHEQIIFVNDSISALQELAQFHRAQFDIPIIAITGSNGKTTTKELIAAVLCKTYRCHFTQGNFNNHLGVPLTILKMPTNTEVAIIEMGANHQGEIAELCEIARPTHGLITNIGRAHLEGFGGIEGVKKAKSELYDFLVKTKGVGFINKDESFLNDLSAGLNYRRVYYGIFDPEEENNWLRIKMVESLSDFLNIQFWDERNKPFDICTQLIGAYNVPNLAAAICLGLYFKVPETAIVDAIESYVPSANRSQLVQYKGAQIILDAYNANPSSVELALKNFAKMGVENKIVILGAMKELGEYQEEEHLSIAVLLERLGFEDAILVGQEFQKAAEQFNFKYFETIDILKENISTQFFNEKNILVKGSRSTRLEKIIVE